MIVSKFGGTSVKDEIAINRLISIIKNRKVKTVVVVSALATVTNNLVSTINCINNKQFDQAIYYLNEIKKLHLNLISNLDLVSELEQIINSEINYLIDLIKAISVIGELTQRTKDMFLGLGEILSSKIIAKQFIKSGVKAKHLDSRHLIKTNSNFTEAEVDFQNTLVVSQTIIKSAFETEDVVVCGGFIASDLEGRMTTLGRGGSDYSASIIASAIHADSLEIWTDVDGILTSDPRLIPQAKLVKQLSYNEASELSYFGAKVLHPKTILPAVEQNIPVWVLNSLKPGKNGSLIVSNSVSHSSVLKAIAFRRSTTIINITSNRMLGAYGFLSKVFEVFKKYETSVDLITTTEVSISLTIDNNKNLKKLQEELSEFSFIEIVENQAIISAVGEGIRNTRGIAARFFGVMKDINIRMVSVGASEINLSIVVDENDLEESVKLLHSEFFEHELVDEIFEEIND